LGIGGSATIHVPFWVVGIEQNGREKLKVYPVGQRRAASEAPTAEQPYVSYLTPHQTHNYEDFVGEVEAYVQQDAVREKLASPEEEFADASFLRRLDGIADRFVDALEQFELSSRNVHTGSQPDVEQQSTRARTKVTTDD